MTEKLTKREMAALGFIKGYISAEQYPPSMQEIADALGSKSPNTARYLLKSLEEKGFVETTPKQPRSIKLIDQ